MTVSKFGEFGGREVGDLEDGRGEADGGEGGGDVVAGAGEVGDAALVLGWELEVDGDDAEGCGGVVVGAREGAVADGAEAFGVGAFGIAGCHDRRKTPPGPARCAGWSEMGLVSLRRQWTVATRGDDVPSDRARDRSVPSRGGGSVSAWTSVLK